MSLCAIIVTLPVMLLPFRSASAQSTGGYPGTTTGGTTTTGTTGTPTPPAGSIHVIWNSDATTTPNLQQAATGGPVGDVGKVHVSFPIPANAFDITLKELRIHEAAGHYSDTVASSPNIGDGTWSPLCGDPDPSQANAPQMQYYDVNWTITGCHNGPHIITATVEYLLYDPTNGNSTGPFDTPYQMSVDVENLLITSTNVNTNYTGTPAAGAPGNSNTDNPTPIFWDPGSMTSVALSAPITAAYASNCTVTLKIYGSDQGLVKTLTQTVGLGGLKTDPGPPPTTSIISTTVPFTWDGTMDGGSSSAPAVKGIYLYQFNVSSLGGYDDYDQDKSSLLSVTQTESDLVDGYNSATDQNMLKDGCVLTDGTNPAPDAIETALRVYGFEGGLNLITGPLSLTPSTVNNPTATTQVWDEITFPMAIQEEEVHLFAARDNHAAQDKGHRTRWTLQKNTHRFNLRADDYSFYNPTQPTADSVAANYQRQIRNLAATPPFFGSYRSYAKGAQGADVILQNLPNDSLMQCSGFGGENFSYYGAFSTNPQSLKIFEHPPYDPQIGYFKMTGCNPMYLQDLPDGSLSKLRIAVWLACYTAAMGSDQNGGYNTGNLVEGTVAKGAQCAVGFTGLITLSTSQGPHPENVWSNAFWQALCQGKNNGNGVPDGSLTSAWDAAAYAASEVSRLCGGYWGVNTCVVGGNGGEFVY